MRPITWCAAALVVFLPHSAVAEEWRGLVVAPEERCTPYNADEYSYPQSVEPQIADRLGGVYSPYTCETFGELTETDIEHIVARSEAHDSGLCLALPERKREFARDIRNLTLSGIPKSLISHAPRGELFRKRPILIIGFRASRCPVREGRSGFFKKEQRLTMRLHRMGTYLHILVCCRPCFKASRRFACTRTK